VLLACWRRGSTSDVMQQQPTSRLGSRPMALAQIVAIVPPFAPVHDSRDLGPGLVTQVMAWGSCQALLGDAWSLLPSAGVGLPADSVMLRCGLLGGALGCVLEGGEVGRLQFRLDRRLECRDPLGLGVLVLLMLFRCAPSGSSLSPFSSECMTPIRVWHVLLHG
jgi:hypothetical protein